MHEDELAAGEIAHYFPAMSRPAVSQHLGVLAGTGLVTVRSSGNLRLYRWRPEGLSDVSAFVQEMWSDRLEALKAAAEREEWPARERARRRMARETGPEDHSVEHEIWINARPETVWRYWIDPARICDWWGASAELDPRPGGTCLVRLGGDTVMRGEFVELTPYRRIVFTLGWEPADGAPPVPPGSSTVTITLAAGNGGTILTLRHTGLPPAARDMHRSGWSHYLPVLGSAAVRPGAQAQRGR